ncbi:MAG: PAS domain-containing protein, partial [Bradyrhizobium sp.]
MAEKNGHASSTMMIAVQAVAGLGTAVAPVPAFALSEPFAPGAYLAGLDAGLIWEALIGGIAVCSLLTAVALWINSALHRARRSQLRRNAFVSSAMNNLNQGVVMTDAQRRVIFCNDRYLEIYGLARSDLWADMTGDEILDLRRQRGVLGVSDDEFYEKAASTNGLITELPDGRAILVKYFVLPNGGSVATHLDVSEQRRLSRQLASTKQFLESVLDNVPACVAAKTVEDGRYIFANAAYERFWGFSRDHVAGKNARELFAPVSAASIEATDRAALNAPDGQFRNEFEIERGAERRLVASTRIVVRNESNRPEFLLLVFEDITDRQSLSQELESTKKFLELVVDNIPVALIVEQVKDGRYLLANRSAETILNRRREEATGLTASDIFNPKEAKLIIARDEAAIKKRGLLTEEHPISTKDGLRLFLTRRMT